MPPNAPLLEISGLSAIKHLGQQTIHTKTAVCLAHSLPIVHNTYIVLFINGFEWEGFLCWRGDL